MKILLFLIACIAHIQAATLKIDSGAYGSGKIYLNANVAGEKERLFLDTGSAMTFVANSKRYEALPKLEDFRFKSATAIEQTIDKIQTSFIQIDQVVFTGPVIGRANFAGAENTLGIDLIAQRAFALDGKRKVFVLNALPPKFPETTLNVSKHGLLSIPITIGGNEVLGLWDSGAGLTTVDSAFVEAHPDAFKATDKYMRGTDGAGQGMLLQVFRAKEITVGKETLKDINVVATDLTVLRENISTNLHAVIGFNVISKGNWYFDAKNRLWQHEGKQR